MITMYLSSYFPAPVSTAQMTVWNLWNCVTGLECPPGHVCPGGSAKPTVCTSGTFQSLSGQTTCDSCPRGNKNKNLFSRFNCTNKLMSLFYLGNVTHYCVQVSTVLRAHLYHLHVHWAPSVCQLAGCPRLTALHAPLASSAMTVHWQSQLDHAVQVW